MSELNDRKPGSRSKPVVVAKGLPTILVIVLCSAILLVGALFFIWQRFQFVHLGFEVAELREREIHLKEIIELLGVEEEYLSRPARIEALARERLGMRRPDPSQVIVLESRETDSPPSQ